jgi:hypothetical protein
MLKSKYRRSSYCSLPLASNLFICREIGTRISSAKSIEKSQASMTRIHRLSGYKGDIRNRIPLAEAQQLLTEREHSTMAARVFGNQPGKRHYQCRSNDSRTQIPAQFRFSDATQRELIPGFR